MIPSPRSSCSDSSKQVRGNTAKATASSAFAFPRFGASRVNPAECHWIVETLLHDPWHEVRLLAVVLLGDAYKRASAGGTSAIFRTYLANAKRINNWDLVDLSAPNIVGAHLATRPRARLDRARAVEELVGAADRDRLDGGIHSSRSSFDDTLRIARAC